METRFFHHAHAVAASGRITLPFQDVIPVQAASVLPVTGGFGSAEAGPLRYKDNLITFERAYTHVTGVFSANDQAYFTEATAVVEGVNILDIVTAGRIVGRIASRHVRPGEQPSIVPLGSRFENLRIACVPVHVDLACDWFSEHDTADRLREAADRDPQINALVPYRDNAGAMLGTLVREARGATGGGVKASGHVITIPQVGRVFLAELFVTAQSRRLTMLRVELGCPHEGDIPMVEVEGNGRFWP